MKDLKKQNNCSTLKSEKGFSLVEVIIALAIFSVIVTPFLSSYIFSNKINRQTQYSKISAEVMKKALEDIKSWDTDVLDYLSNDEFDSDTEKEFEYLNTEGKVAMDAAVMKVLEGKSSTLEVDGEKWADGMDIYYKITKAEAPSLREGRYDTTDYSEDSYDLVINVDEDKITAKDMNNPTYVSQNDNNNGNGYYLSIIIEDNKAGFKLRNIPANYIPLEKVSVDKRILFGGKHWLPAFAPSAGNRALMYIPSEEDSIKREFDRRGEVEFRQDNGEDSWKNMASYLNNEFYDSLVYNTYLSSIAENYSTNREWIVNHRWFTGKSGSELDSYVEEKVGLLRESEVLMLNSYINAYLTDNDYNWLTKDSWTLTPGGSSSMRLISGGLATPTDEKYAYPIIYLKNGLYCYTKDSVCRLYDCTSPKLKTGYTDLEGSTIAGSDFKLRVYFDKNLSRKNLQGEYAEKLRLLVDVIDNRRVKEELLEDDIVTIDVINNKNMGDYNWFEVYNASEENDFKVKDNIYMENEPEATQIFPWSAYRVEVWAEYLNSGEYKENENARMQKQDDIETIIYRNDKNPRYDEGGYIIP